MIKRIHQFFPLSLLALTLLISGCGFHVRGSNELNQSIDELYISGKYRDDTLAKKVLQLATDNGATVTVNSAWTIDIISESYNERRLTSTQSVSQDEFMLSLHVSFNLIHSSENDDMTYGPITIKRESIFQGDENQTASKDNEKRLLLTELQQRLAMAILRQTQIIAANPPKCDCHHENQIPAISQ